MKKEIAEYLFLIILLSVLTLLYCFYVIRDERRKMKYYKQTISYETKWDKYSDMVAAQKRVIIKKQIQLFFLNILVFLKGLIIWKQ